MAYRPASLSQGKMTLPTNLIRARFSEYFNSPTYSDVTIKFSGQEIFAHKIVLASSSEYFKMMFERGFKETTSPSIELHEDPPEAIKIIVRNCYAGVSGVTVPAKASPQVKHEKLVEMVDLFVTSGKYLLPALRDVTARSFAQNTRILPQDPRIQPGKTLPTWFDSIARHLWTTPIEQVEELRQYLVHELSNHVVDFKNDEVFKTLMFDVPELSFEVLKSVADTTLGVTGTRLPSFDLMPPFEQAPEMRKRPRRGALVPLPPPGPSGPPGPHGLPEEI